MGKKSSPKAPETPDYMAIAQQQEGIDKRTAENIADMSRINQVNPMGSQTWSQGGDGRWTQTQNLSEGQQQMFDTAEGLNIGVGQAATDALGDYTGMIGQPLDLNGLPQRQGTPQAGDLNRNVDSAQFGSTFDQRWADQGFGALPTAGEYGGDARQQVIDTMYGMSQKQLDPQFQQEEASMRNRLLNSGVREGTEAWNNAWDDFSRQRTSAYGDARDRAVIGGGQEQSRLLRDAMGVRSQGYGEAMGGAQQTDNEAMNRFNAQLSELGFENDAQALDYQQQLAGSQVGEQQRSNALQELLMQRQIPMNELAGIIGASGQFALPQFGAGTQNVPQYQGADVMGATQAGFGADMSKYNAETAGSNSKKSNAAGLGGSLGSAAIGAGLFGSDIRLKKNIEKIGTASGHNMYVWDWNDKAKMLGVANHPRIGVMAQELQQYKPEAVVEMKDGYLAVDYSKVWEK